MSLATTTMIVLSLQIITCFLFTATASSPHGFTIDLIHRPSNSSSSRLSKTQLGSSPYADTVYNPVGDYLMKLQIGTPPVEIIAELDTGSEIIWTQCLPCLDCFDQFDPIFDPSKSSTFKEKRCDDQPCPYEVVYADNSYSKGTYATETVTLHSSSGEPFVMPETTIGCGRNNSGFGATSSGIVGLDWGPMSLISQMGKSYHGLISYCFAGKRTSKINFGDNAYVGGEGTVAAKMFKKKEEEGWYYLNLDAISVEANRVETSGTPFHAKDGNIMIDSGTTYTYLPESYFNQVKDAVAKVVTAERVTDSINSDKLCYSSNTIEIFPVITMHFAGGADLVLDKYNMYKESDNGGTFCLTILSTPEQAVFGNRAQNNFVVGYDPSSRLVSFKPANCSGPWSGGHRPSGGYRPSGGNKPRGSLLYIFIVLTSVFFFYLFVLALN